MQKDREALELRALAKLHQHEEIRHGHCEGMGTVTSLLFSNCVRSLSEHKSTNGNPTRLTKDTSAPFTAWLAFHDSLYFSLMRLLAVAAGDPRRQDLVH